MAYMTADDLRDRVPALDDPDITDTMLEDLVEEFEDIAERYLGVAYESRSETETFDLDQDTLVVLKWVKVTAVGTITIDGDAVDSDDYTFTDGYAITFTSPRTGVLSVTYTHGEATPTKPLLRAGREYVKACALSDRSRVPRDVISQSGEGFTTRYSTPDWDRGRPTGYIEVDRLLNSLPMYRLPGIH